jgi:hypothetical protein
VIHHLKIRVKQKIKAVDKEIGVFEISQHRKVQQNRHCQKQLSFGTVLRTVNPFPDKIVEHNAEQHEEKEKTTGFVIKENTQNKQVSSSYAAVFVFVHERITQQNKGKKSPEKETGKNKRRPRIIKENGAERRADIKLCQKIHGLFF